MRVLVTGASGFVGAHSVAALVGAGHQVRALVRDPARLVAALRPLGVEAHDYAIGDIVDRSSIERAMAGQDGLLHAAAIYSFSPREDVAMRRTNAAGTENVLGAAVARGFSPIVHVSSTVSLLPPNGTLLSADGPVGTPAGAYSRSKAESEAVARRYQESYEGLTITYPGQVLGPHDPHFGEGDRLVTGALKGQFKVSFDGGGFAVDARDVARLHAAIFERRPARGRFIVPGSYVDIVGLLGMLSELTGRKLTTRLAPLPVVLSVGRIADVAARVLPVRPPLSHAMLWVASQKADADDSRTRKQFGLHPRPIEETLAETIRSLLARGRISAHEAGTLASRPLAV